MKTNLCQGCKYINCTYVPPIKVPHASLLLIGEAPGATEEQQGVPFIGASGQYVRNILRETGYNLQDVAITNSCLCRPPDNETPAKKEYDLCSQQFLFRFIDEVSPKAILCLGQVAAKAFVKSKNLTEVSGQLMDYKGSKVLCTFHPSAVLRSPEREPGFRRDIKQLYNATHYTELRRRFVYVKDLAGIEEVKAWIKTKDRSGTDIETANALGQGTLDPFDRGARVTMIAFGDDKVSFSIALDRDDDPAYMRTAVDFVAEQLRSKDNLNIFCRCWFDTKFMQARNMHTNNFTDIRIKSFLLNENRMTHGLKELVLEMIGPYQHSMDTKDRVEMAMYNAEDASNTYIINDKFDAQMTPKLRTVLTRIILPAIPILNEMMLTGFVIDQPYAKKLTRDLKKEKEDTHGGLLQKFPVFRGIKLSSTDQLSRIIFGPLKAKVLKENKTGPSLDEEVMNQYAFQGKEWAKLIVQMRKIDKLLSTYVEKMPAIVNDDGRLRCEFDVTGTVTGRLSSRNPNLQNIPRQDRIYRMFRAGPGKWLFYFDFSQIELRVGASVACEPKMIEAYRNGIDLHKQTAAFVCGKKPDEVTKEERQLAKGCIDGEAWVLTKRGILKLKDVLEGDYIYTGTRYCKVLVKKCTGIKQCTTIKGSVGIKVKGTPDHDFLTNRGWHSAKLIKDNIRKDVSWYKAIVAVPSEENANEYFVFPSVPLYKKKTWHSNKVILPSHCCSDLALVLGFIAAEGYIGRKGVSIHADAEPKFKWDEFAMKARKIFGHSFKEKDEGSSKKFYLSGVDIVKWMQANGMAGKSQDKQIPECIMRNGRAAQGAYVRGLWYGDGTIRTSGEAWTASERIDSVSIVLKSSVLIEQLQILLLYNGIMSRQSVEPIEGYGDFYRLTIMVCDIGKFLDFSGIRGFDKLPKGKQSIDHIFDNYLMPVVSSKERTKKIEVYDLEVEGDHRFVVNGFIVHNCNFGLLYGQESEGLREYLFDKFSIEVSSERAVAIREAFFAQYTGLLAWYRRVRSEVKQNYQVEYPTGRLRRFPEVKALDFVPNNIMRMAVNAPVQGSANDIALFTASNLGRLRDKRKLPVKFVSAVHDSVIMEIDQSKDLAEEMRDLVEMTIKEVVPNDPLFKWLKVPLEADFKVGDNWGDLHNI